jgi:mono/diheme cytochrome c family protein
LTVNDATIAAGKRLFNDKCARCHGLHGKGDGPTATRPTEQMDLTARRARNPDSVIFYRSGTAGRRSGCDNRRND